MMIFANESDAARDLTAGKLACPSPGCDGQLGPWGWGRPRTTRLPGGRSQRHTPRRARCRSCRRTQILGSARSFPRRPDAVETVGRALLAALDGDSHRQIAEDLDLSATTVRGWLRRARANSETVRGFATRWVYGLDVQAPPLEPTGTPFGDMIDAIGRAMSACVGRFGPIAHPWRLAVMLTAGRLLAAPGDTQFCHPLDTT